MAKKKDYGEKGMIYALLHNVDASTIGYYADVSDNDEIEEVRDAAIEALRAEGDELYITENGDYYDKDLHSIIRGAAEVWRGKHEYANNENFAKGGDITLNHVFGDLDAFTLILLRHGFVEQRGAYGIRKFYNKQKNFYVAVDNERREMEAFRVFGESQVDRSFIRYAISDLQAYLTTNKYPEGIDDSVIPAKYKGWKEYLIVDEDGELQGKYKDYLQAVSFAIRYNMRIVKDIPGLIRKENGGGLDKFAKGGETENVSREEKMRKVKNEMNIAVNTQTGNVYIGGTKPKNILYKDEKGYFLIDGYGKFANKKYPIKKYFTDDIEVAVLREYMGESDSKFARGGSISTFADLKRKLVKGQGIKLVYWFGQTPDNIISLATPNAGTSRLGRTRYIVKAQTNGIYISDDQNATTGSWWEFPPASLVEVNNAGFKVYGIGTRPFNEAEQRMLDNEPKDEQQSYIDAISDGSTMYYRKKHYYESAGYGYLMGNWEKGLYRDYNNNNIKDKSIRGNLELEYKFVNNPAQMADGGGVDVDLSEYGRALYENYRGNIADVITKVKDMIAVDKQGGVIDFSNEIYNLASIIPYSPFSEEEKKLFYEQTGIDKNTLYYWSGGTVHTSNRDASSYVSSKEPFRANNLEGRKGVGDSYVVLSYGYYPVFVYYDGEWYENANKYSPSTAKQMGQSRPTPNTIKKSTEQLTAMYEGRYVPEPAPVIIAVGDRIVFAKRKALKGIVIKVAGNMLTAEWQDDDGKLVPVGKRKTFDISVDDVRVVDKFATGGGITKGEFANSDIKILDWSFTDKYESDLKIKTSDGEEIYTVDDDVSHELDFHGSNDDAITGARDGFTWALNPDESRRVRVKFYSKSGNPDDPDWVDGEVLEKQGVQVKKGLRVWNETDGIYATPEVFESREEATAFVNQFMKRFIQQGYYLTSRGERLLPRELELMITPVGDPPLPFAKGGGFQADVTQEQVEKYQRENKGSATDQNYARGGELEGGFFKNIVSEYNKSDGDRQKFYGKINQEAKKLSDPQLIKVMQSYKAFTKRDELYFGALIKEGKKYYDEDTGKPITKAEKKFRRNLLIEMIGEEATYRIDK